MRRLAPWITAIIPLTMLALPSVSAAAKPPWTYVEAGYNDVDLNDIDDSGDGYFLGGSFGWKMIHFFGRYTKNETDLNTDLESFTLGGGWHGLLGEKADLFFDAAYVDADYGPVSDSGWFGRGGVRWRLIKLLELGANARWEDLGDLDDDVKWEAHATFYVWRIGLGVNWEKADDFDTYSVFARFVFGEN